MNGRGSLVRSVCSTMWLLLIAAAAVAHADTTVVVRLVPGSPLETDALLSQIRTVARTGVRTIDPSGSAIYHIVLPPGAPCVLSITATGVPTVSVTGMDQKQLATWAPEADGTLVGRFVVPANQPVGGYVRVEIVAGAVPVNLALLRVEVKLIDSTGRRIGDFAERLLGLPSGKHATAYVKSPIPHTSFQTGDAYRPEIAVPTDSVLVYTDSKDLITSWSEHGQSVMTMGGFRRGTAFAAAHPGDLQTTREGKPIVIDGSSYYVVPTAAGVERAEKYYENAIQSGSGAVCPEEPELWGQAGYSAAFKLAWKERYHTAWQDPQSSVTARYHSEQLKGWLEEWQIGSILNHVKETRPAVTRMVAVHSPVTYYQMHLPVPHYRLLSLKAVDAIIGQVWTGTAKTPSKLAGVRAERTFETGYLEYSSLYELAHGTGKRLWFLTDPLEDAQGLAIEDYHRNYEQTVLASLMFPDVDQYEVMPWPARVYGHVPDAYAGEINTIVGTLCTLWQYPDGKVEAGSEGIGTFVADSMGWQREPPDASDYDGFYGLTLPLVDHGIPVRVLSLDRATEPLYLRSVKALLVSFDYLKPPSQESCAALAAWVRAGGSLSLFGGTDAYNGVKDSWWRVAGFASPVDCLFSQLGLITRNTGVVAPLSGPEPTADYKVILKADGTYHALQNRKQYSVDISPYVSATGSVEVRFANAAHVGGWGPTLVSTAVRADGKLEVEFKAGSELETRFLTRDTESSVNAIGRFADDGSSWVYQFDNLPTHGKLELVLDIGNDFEVSARQASPNARSLEAAVAGGDMDLQRLPVPSAYSITSYTPPTGAQVLYKVNPGGEPAVWSAACGKGLVTYVGVAPGFVSSNAQSSRLLRALARAALESAGTAYAESPAFVLRRGPYLAVQTLSKPVTANGFYVDMLDPDLRVLMDPEVAARGWALLKQAGAPTPEPRLLAVSGRVRAQYDGPTGCSFIVQSPAGTTGAARIWNGSRSILGVKAFTMLGESIPVTYKLQGSTTLLKFGNNPDGVVCRLVWK